MFDQESYKNLKKGLEHDYLEYVISLQSHLDEISKHPLLSDNFIQFFNILMVSKEIKKFSSLNFYFINLIEDLSFTLECLEDEDEDSLIDFFTASDLAQYFLELCEQLKPLEASIAMISKIEEKIMSFFEIKIKSTKSLTQPIFALPELGDSQRVYCGDYNNYFNTEEANKFEPIKLLSTDFLTLVPRDNLSENVVNSQFNRISNALKLIKEHSPDCYTALESFSSHVIPIDEEQLVSYSIQELPGYSCINMFNRDDIDLIDDLVHENGHHYLNAHLNVTELIIEDDDEIFFSPWRNQKRPVRGIYHAYLTFYWAYKLFGDLSKAIIDKKLSLAPDQEQKVYKRFLEESDMLKKSYKEIREAKKLGKVTEEGMELVKVFETKFNFDSQFISSVKDLLSS